MFSCSITRFSLLMIRLSIEVLVRMFSTKASCEPLTTTSFSGFEMLLVW